MLKITRPRQTQRGQMHTDKWHLLYRVSPMTEITVRALGPSDWQIYRDVRLASLRDAPEAFASTASAEEAEPEQTWHDRMARATRIVAEQDGRPVGVASVGDDDNGVEGSAEVFGVWVAPELRGTGLATQLIGEAASAASSRGRTQLAYWVGTDNARAVAFASGIGFRPGDARRKMRGGNDDEDEILMVLALGNNRGEPTVTRTF